MRARAPTISGILFVFYLAGVIAFTRYYYACARMKSDFVKHSQAQYERHESSCVLPIDLF